MAKEIMMMEKMVKIVNCRPAALPPVTNAIGHYLSPLPLQHVASKIKTTSATTRPEAKTTNSWKVNIN